jgi:potassium-transporting ATPase potassium-binding subunit
LVMLFARYWTAIPILAIAGSLCKKKTIPQTTGTFTTDNMMFVALLFSVVLIIGALSFLPVLFLGPLIEHLMLWWR